MSTTVEALPEHQEQALAELRKSDVAIAEMRQYLDLTVEDFSDRKQIAAVEDAHKQVKKTRVGIDKKRKQLNEDALAWQRAVNDEAKRLIDEVRAIEDHLKGERDKVESEKQRVKQEKEREAQALLQARVEQMQAVEGELNLLQLRVMSDETFTEALREATAAFNQKQILAAELDEQRDWQQKLAAVGHITTLEVLADLTIAERETLLESNTQEFHEAEERKAREEAETAHSQEIWVQLIQIGYQVGMSHLKAIGKENRNALLAEAKQKWELAEEERKAQEAAERELQEAQDAKIREQEAELAKLRAAEQKRLDEEEARHKAEELKKAEEARRIEREAEEKARVEREAELAPLREHLGNFAGQIRNFELPGPLMHLDEEIGRILDEAADKILAIIDKQ